MCGTLFPSTLITSTLAPPGSTSVTAYEKVVWWVGLGWAVQARQLAFLKLVGRERGGGTGSAVHGMCCAGSEKSLDNNNHRVYTLTVYLRRKCGAEANKKPEKDSRGRLLER